MNPTRLLIVLTAIVALALLGTATVRAITVPPGDRGGTCEEKFAMMDSGQKGYLTENDFADGLYGTGGHLGMAPAAEEKFASANRRGDGKLTKDEYCAWIHNR